MNEEVKPIPSRQAARMLKRMQAESERRATPTELGLAIASLALGVLVAISAVPAGILLGVQNSAITLISLFAFATVSVVLGVLGKKNAMGVAGMALGIVALVETASVYGYFSYQQEQERRAEIAKEKERTRQAEEKRVLAQIELAQRQAETAKSVAEAKYREMERIREEELRRENLRSRMAQEEEKARKEQAERAKMEQEEAARREAEERETRKQAELERKQRLKERQEEGHRLLDRLITAYPKALQDYKAVSVEVREKWEEIHKNEEEIKSLEIRLKNLSMIVDKLSSEDPQRKKYLSEKERIQGLLGQKNSYYNAPEIISYEPRPDPQWRVIAAEEGGVANLLADGSLQDRYLYAGNRLARIHSALLGAIDDLSLQNYEREMIGSGEKLLVISNPTRKSATTARSIRRRP